MREVILNDFNIIFFYLSITYFCNGGNLFEKERAYIELLD